MNVLANEPDFKETTLYLNEVIVKKHKQHLIYLPVCTPEGNPIELVWPHTKAIVRKNNNDNIKMTVAKLKDDLPNIMKQAVDKCNIKMVFMHCMKYFVCYQMGLTGDALEFALKQYKRHRQTENNIVYNQIEAQFNQLNIPVFDANIQIVNPVLEFEAMEEALGDLLEEQA